MSFEYECALSGIVENGGIEFDGDGMGDLPAGWTQVIIKRRAYNPKWLLLQQLKHSMVQALLGQFAEGVSDAQRAGVELQVEAQFHSIEQGTPVYVNDVDDVVYISAGSEILDNVNEFRALLSLEPVSVDDEEDEDEDEESGPAVSQDRDDNDDDDDEED